MNEAEKRYLYFYVKDYTGVYSTSGYTLPISPFTFIPILDDVSDTNISNTNIYWDFGDGTISRDITATHYYTTPGIYYVSCLFLANSGRGYESMFKQSISVRDFYSDTLILSASIDKVNSAAHIDTTLLLSRINSWQSYSSNKKYTISLYTSGEGATPLDIDTYNSDKFAHLKPNSRFLAYEYNDNTASYELAPVNSITTYNDRLLYVCLTPSGIVPCLSSTLGATFAGTSGQRLFYFTDDMPSSEISIIAYFNSLDFKDRYSSSHYTPDSIYPILHQSNTATYSLSFDDNQIPLYLSITSNGIDGEETNITSFNITAEKYTNQTIPFVVKVKDDQRYTIKSSKVLLLEEVGLTEDTVNVALVDSNNVTLTDVIIESNFGILSSELYGGFFRGTLKSSKPYTNVRISASAIVRGVLITGLSDVFSIYENSQYSIGKINENFDASAQFQTYVFQESFQDYYRFFNDLIGTSLGDSNSDPTYLGKKIYERISNFTNNLASVDTCTIEALKSMYSMLGEDFYAFHKFNFNYPAEINRLIEIFSIRFSKLKGGRNKFNQYFQDKGYSNVDVKYGRNRGKELNILTTILTAGSASQPIVAYERFSEQYTLLNTNILSSAYTSFIDPTMQTYALSSFNKWWGWELVLPVSYNIHDIQKYYNFYEYKPGVDDTQLEGIINWSDSFTTINESLSSIYEWDKIRESMITHALIKAMMINRPK